MVCVTAKVTVTVIQVMPLQIARNQGPEGPMTVDLPGKGLQEDGNQLTQ